MAENPPEDSAPDYEDGSFDAGLWALSEVAYPGEKFSLYAIAEVCGCSYEWIRQLEEKALKKVRLKLRHSIGIIDQKQFSREKVLSELDVEIPEHRL